MMVIPIPTGRSYTATLKGWVWKPVQCEHCGCEFAYKLSISAKGSGFSPLYLNNTGASATARRKAEEDFNRQADRSIGIISCPDCGMYQQNMVSRLKAQQRSSVLGWCFGFGAVALVAYFIITQGTLNQFVCLPIALVELLIFVLLLWRTRSYDPNGEADSRQSWSYSDSYQVLRRTEFEQLAALAQAQGTPISIPQWP